MPSALGLGGVEPVAGDEPGVAGGELDPDRAGTQVGRAADHDAGPSVDPAAVRALLLAAGESSGPGGSGGAIAVGEAHLGPWRGEVPDVVPALTSIAHGGEPQSEAEARFG